MTADTNIVADIKGRIDVAGYDFARAEGRARLDNALRAELDAIADKWLRGHVAEMLREWRRELFGGVSESDVIDIARRVAAIEAYLRRTGGADWDAVLWDHG